MAGLFDALLGSVDTSPISAAARKQKQADQQAQQQIKKAKTEALGYVGGAQPTAEAALRTGVGTATGDIQTALGQGIGAIDTGYGTATGDIGQALGLYAPLAQTADQAFQLYGGALGVGGPDATAAARGAFTASPGYQYQLAQGQDALARLANSRGMLGSGNLTGDELAFSQNLANQDYQQWLNNLWNQGSLAPGIAGAQSGLYGALANLATGRGTTEAGMYGQAGTQMADLASGLGSNLANLYTGTAGEQAGITTGAGQNLANLKMAQGQQAYGSAADIFNAQQQANQNALNFWGNLASAGAGAAGRYFGAPTSARGP